MSKLAQPFEELLNNKSAMKAVCDEIRREQIYLAQDNHKKFINNICKRRGKKALWK